MSLDQDLVRLVREVVKAELNSSRTNATEIVGRGGDTVLSSMGNIFIQPGTNKKAYYHETEIGSGAGAGGTTVKVSANDTTAGYLNGKLVASTGITLTENSDGGNETLSIAVSGGSYGDVFTNVDNIFTADHQIIRGAGGSEANYPTILFRNTTWAATDYRVLQLTDTGLLNIGDGDFVNIHMNSATYFDSVMSPTTTDTRDVGDSSHWWNEVFAQKYYVDDASTYISNVAGDMKFFDAANATGKTLTELAAGGDHGALTGLGDDDHVQYILKNGTRAMTGDLAFTGVTNPKITFDTTTTFITENSTTNDLAFYRENVLKLTIGASAITAAVPLAMGSNEITALTGLNDIRIEFITANIQAAIDSVAVSTTVHKLIITGDHTLSNILIWGAEKFIEFTGKITAGVNTPAIIVGDSTHNFIHSRLKYNTITGDSWTGSTEGILLQNSTRSFIIGNYINTVKYAIKIKSVGFVNDNYFYFGEIVWTDIGIYFDPTMTNNAEGNTFFGSVFGCTTSGFSISNGSGGASSRYAAYYGVVDNMYYPSAKDIVDNAGNNMFYLTFIQDSLNPAKNTLHPNSVMIEMGSGRTFLANPIIKTTADPILKMLNENNNGWFIYQQNTAENDFAIAKAIDNVWTQTCLTIKYATGRVGLNINPQAALHINQLTNEGIVLYDPDSTSGKRSFRQTISADSLFIHAIADDGVTWIRDILSLVHDGRIDTYCNIEPFTDNLYSCGVNNYRWALVRGVTITPGDLGFEERKCAICNQPFEIGEILSLQVVEINDPDAPTRCVPVHNHHNHGDKFVWKKQERNRDIKI